jgi:hypothetical protein
MKGQGKTTRAFLIVVLLLACLLPGCGGGGGGDSTASGPLTRRQFIEQTASICQKVGKERQLQIEELGPKALAGSQQELEDVVRKVIFPLYQEAIAKMARLNPPKGDREAAKLVNRLETTLKKAEADPGTLIKHNSFIEVDQAAAKYGIEGCTF